jgi:putative peptidoglycan lipid II flippase
MAFRATFLVVVGVTLVGQLAALGFEMAAAARFGTGLEADALAFALTLVFALTTEIVGWISTLFVPLYVEVRATSAAGAGRFLRRVLVALVIGLGAAALVLALVAGPMVGMLAPSLGARGVAVMRAFVPLVALVPLAGLFAAVLHAHGRFVGASLRQLAWYGGGLAGIVAFGATLGAVAAPLGMLAGVAVFTALLAVAALRDARAPAGGGPGPALATLAPRLVPLLVLSACAATNVAVERALAARLPVGSLAALTYAYRLLHFPLALFVVNATAMLLPVLAAHAVRGDAAALGALAHRALRLTVVFTIPLAVLAAALAEPLTALLLERGAFTPASTAATATAIAWYAPGVVAMALTQVLFRAFQALHALWRLAFTVGAGLVLNVVLMQVLTALFGFRGLALASSVSAFVAVALMRAALEHRVPGLGGALASRATGVIVVAGVAAGVAAVLARGFAGESPVSGLLAGGGAGVAVYAGLLLAFAPAEARAALAALAPAWGGRSA